MGARQNTHKAPGRARTGGQLQIVFRGQDWGQKYPIFNKSLINIYFLMASGGPRRIRTPDPLIRSQVLYPAELSVRGAVN